MAGNISHEKGHLVLPHQDVLNEIPTQIERRIDAMTKGIGAERYR